MTNDNLALGIPAISAAFRMYAASLLLPLPPLLLSSPISLITHNVSHVLRLFIKQENAL